MLDVPPSQVLHRLRVHVSLAAPLGLPKQEQPIVLGERQTVRRSAVHAAHATRLTVKILDEPRHHLVLRFRMPQTPEAAETPRERPLLAVDGHGVILTAAKVHDLGHIHRRHVPVLALLDVEHDTLRARFVIEAQLRAGLEILAVGIVAQLAVLRQAERVQAPLDVQDNGELCAAADLHKPTSC